MSTPRRGIDSLVSIASGDRLDLAAIAEPPAWYGDAACPSTDPEAFYPEKGGSTQPDKAVCLSCSVRSKCLAYALERNEAHGVWGGLSEKQRRQLKRAAA